MSISDVFNFLFLAGFIVASVLVARRGRQQRQARSAGAERLGIKDFVQTSIGMEGNARGHHLEIRFVSATKQTAAHTDITVSCAPCAVELHLRPQDAAEQRAVAEGRAVDVTLGDPAFDAAWIVEGAPAARVPRILADPTLRARLVAFGGIAAARVDVSDGKLVLHRLGIASEDFPTEPIELALTLADAVVADAAEPLASSDPSEAGADYRRAPQASGDAAGAAEIQALKVLRRKRAIHELRLPIIILSSFATGLMLVVRLAGAEGPLMIVMLVVAVVLTAMLLLMLQSNRSEARGVPLEPMPLWWMAGCWVLNLALAVPAFVGSASPSPPAHPSVEQRPPSSSGHQAPAQHRPGTEALSPPASPGSRRSR